MSERTQIVEKRVKSTIIRRRKEVEPPSPPPPQTVVEVVPPVVEGKQDEAKSVVVEVKKEGSLNKQTIPQLTDITKQAHQKPEATKDAKTEKAAPDKKEEEKKALATKKPMIPLLELEEEEGEKKKVHLKKVIKKKEPDLVVDVEGIGRVSTITQLTRIAHVDRVERVFQPSRLSRKKKIISRKNIKHTSITLSKPIKRIVEVSGSITAGDLAQAMGVKSGEVIKKLMGMGVMATMNQSLDLDTATLIAHEYQHEIKNIAFDEQKVLGRFDEKISGSLEPRPPVVTVMGHVDHGKTSLLDAIRQTNVTAGEAGGITQHIGAYTITLPKGKITFLDTPGHEAFTSMRARGASVTDLVVLVVAADDGVMPQTIESIDHAKAAGVPIVVAVNKIDKPEADLDRIKRQLSDRGLSPEEWGGQTLYAYVSAKQKKGIPELLETILLQAEVLEPKANPKVPARGIVIEARLDRSRGPVATVLVQEGTLHAGDILFAGSFSGNVRAMLDHTGKPTDVAYPAYAVEILGLDGVPFASETFHVVPDEQTAKQIIENRIEEKRKADVVPLTKVSLEDFFAKSQNLLLKELNVVLKTDVQGSLEAVANALSKLPSEKVKLKIIHSAVGGINESDILLASASNAIVMGFNVRPETKAIGVAKLEGVDVRVYKIIYEMLDDVKKAMQGLLAPTKKEKYLGRAEIRQVFTVSKIGTIAGCSVVDGKIVRGAALRLLRNSVILHEGKISTLKRFKDDVKEVLQGFECGLSIEGYQDIKPGDLIEAFEVELIQTEL